MTKEGTRKVFFSKLESQEHNIDIIKFVEPVI